MGPLIVFNLSCAADHRFEGWFASGEDFDAQRGRGLLSCPMCGSSEVSKQLSAPRLNLLHAQSDERQSKQDKHPRRDLPATHGHGHGSGHGTAAEVMDGESQGMAMLSPQQHDMLRELIRQVVENTEDVGNRFAEEARRIHYKEADARAIRGVATREEAESLVEEGIEVAQLPVPMLDKSQLN